MDKYSMDLLKKVNITELNKYKDHLIDQVFHWFMNAVEDLSSENTQLKRVLQECKNELNILKGEKGKPEIKASVKNQNNDTSIKNDTIEKNLSKKWSKSSKQDKIKIDRIELLKIDKSILPLDAEFKGYEEVSIQEIIIHTDNVLLKREKYYSPSEHKIYMAELPYDFKDTEFGPNLKALCAILYFDYRVTENKIVKFLSEFGIRLQRQYKYIL